MSQNQIEDDGDVAPLHKYVHQMDDEPAPPATDSATEHNADEDDDFDSFAETNLQLQSDEDDNFETTDPVLDLNLLKNLQNSLGGSQCKDLLGGFSDTGEELISHLEACEKSQNLDDIRDRAHELKGMAGNFGVLVLSSVAARIEDAAGKQDLASALTAIEELDEAHQKAAHAIEKWIGETED